MFNEVADGRYKVRLQQVGIFVLVVLGLYLTSLAIGGFANLRYVGAGIPPSNTITVSGEGESFAVPDIATFSFTVTEEGATSAAAQEKATEKINDATAYLKEQKIDEKDIKTIAYNIYPKYEYETQACPVSSSGISYPCVPGKQKLVGYETSQTISVKVRDTKVAGDLLVGIGKVGISNVSGVDFTVDDDNAIKDEAREKAIVQAREHAEVLAKQLGVRLVRVVSFNENGSPYYYAYDSKVALEAGGRGGATPSVAPDLPVGENKYTSNVTVTYEIR